MQRYPGSIATCDHSAQTSQTDGLASWHKRDYNEECKWYQSAFTTFYQNQLIAMATSLRILENEVEVYHLHPKRFHMVQRL